MKSETKDFYAFGGINRDVNPFLMKDSDLWMATNVYARTVGSKKVRFGYTKFLDKLPGSVRSLHYFDLPTVGKGIFAVSGKALYKNDLVSGTWGGSVQNFTVDSVTPFADLSGSTPYVHYGNATDGYYTFDGTTYKHWAGAYTHNPTTIAAWDSRIFMDINQLTLAESAISFDLNAGYTTDPFTTNNNDPSGGGIVTLDSGNNGRIQFITASIDRIQVYKQQAVYRFNGGAFFELPYAGNILAVCSTKYNTDYFLASNGIWRNDGNNITFASMGVQTIILDTLRVHGITNPVAFSFDDYTIFSIGTLRIGQGNQYVDVPNGCLVHHERFDEWYVWSLGHKMTAFGYYVDPTSNEPRLISGDANGNTYVWGEEYASDNGLPINYHLRSKYFDMGKPTSSKIPSRWYASTSVGAGALIQTAVNYSDSFVDLGSVQGFLSKDFFDLDTFGTDFKTLSIQMKGSTTTDRPELNGFSVMYLDEEDRYEDKQANRK